MVRPMKLAPIVVALMNLIIAETIAELAPKSLALQTSAATGPGVLVPADAEPAGDDGVVGPSSGDDDDDYNDYGAYVIYDLGGNNSSASSATSDRAGSNGNNNNNNNYNNSPTNEFDGADDADADSSDRSLASSSESPSSFQVIFFAAMPPYKLTTSTTATSPPAANSFIPAPLSTWSHQQHQINTRLDRPSSTSADGADRGAQLLAQVANDSSAGRPKTPPKVDPSQVGLAEMNPMDGRAQSPASRGDPATGPLPAPSRHHRARRHRAKEDADRAARRGRHSYSTANESLALDLPLGELDEEDVKWLRNIEAAKPSRAHQGKPDMSRAAAAAASATPSPALKYFAKPNEAFNQAAREEEEEAAAAATATEKEDPEEEEKEEEVGKQESRPELEGADGAGERAPIRANASDMIMAKGEGGGAPTAPDQHPIAHYNNGSSHLASSGADASSSPLAAEVPAHNVYYWRLIWFVLPVGATFGNLLVIMAVYRERSLQSVTNYFIVSLAFADLFVGLIVMPFAVYVLVNEVWELSDTICDIYVAVDVTSSTASILNLVAISIDRYRAVAYPIAYTASSSSTIAILTICGVWLISCGVGAPIIFGLNTTPGRKSTLCILYNSTYIFWSSLASFYIPCIAMIALYWRIFSAIRSRTKKAIQAGGQQQHHHAANSSSKPAKSSTCALAPVTAAAASALRVANAAAQPNGSKRLASGAGDETGGGCESRQQATAKDGARREMILSPSFAAAAAQGKECLRAPSGDPPDEPPDNNNNNNNNNDPAAPLDNHLKVSPPPTRRNSASAASDGRTQWRQSITRDQPRARVDSQPEVGRKRAQGGQQSATSGVEAPAHRPLDRSSAPACILHPALAHTVCCPLAKRPPEPGCAKAVRADLNRLLTTRLAEMETRAKNVSQSPRPVDNEDELGPVGPVPTNEMTSAAGSPAVHCPNGGELQTVGELKLAPLQVHWCRCPPPAPAQQNHCNSIKFTAPLDCRSRFISKLARCCQSKASGGDYSTLTEASSSCDDCSLVGLALAAQSVPMKRLLAAGTGASQSTPSSDSHQLVPGAHHQRANKDNGESLVELLRRPAADQIFISAHLYAQPSEHQTPGGPRVLLERLHVLDFNQPTSNHLPIGQPGQKQSRAELSNSDLRALHLILDSQRSLCDEIILRPKCRFRQEQLCSANNDGYLSEHCLCCGGPLATAAVTSGTNSELLSPTTLSLVETDTGNCDQLTKMTVLQLDELNGPSDMFELFVARSPAQHHQNSSLSALVFSWSASLAPPIEYRRILALGHRSSVCAHCSTSCLLASVVRLQLRDETCVDKRSPDPLATSSVLSTAGGREEFDTYRNKQPSNLQATTEVIRLDMDLECSHLSRLLKKEQRQAKHQQQLAIDMDPEEVDSGSESSASAEDEDIEAESRSESSSSSGSTNFRVGSSSSSSATGFECSELAAHNGYEQSTCTRRSCCRLSPTCKACQANSTSSRWVSGKREAPPDGRDPRNRSSRKSERTSAEHCDCVTLSAESTACQQLALRVTQEARNSSLQNQPLSGGGSCGGLDDDSENQLNTCIDKHSQTPAKLAANNFDRGLSAKAHTQSVSVLQSATEQIKRRSMRLSQLIRGSRSFRSGLTSTRERSEGGRKATAAPLKANRQLNTSRTNSDEDPYSSSAVLPGGTTSVFTNKSTLANAITVGKPEAQSVNSASVAGGLKLAGQQEAIDQNLEPAEVAQLCGKEKTSIMNHSVNFTTESRSCGVSGGGGKTNWTLSSDIPTADSSSSNNSNRLKSSLSKHSYLMASVINIMQPSQRSAQATSADRKHGNGPTKPPKGAKKIDAPALVPVSRHRVGGSRRRREKNAARRERKATKTLAIVLGIFLICWTPFFTCNIIDGICIQLDMDCRPGMMVYLVTSWLGYINSCVNPIIYTIFNMEFRRAFKKILTTPPSCFSDN